MPKRIGPDCVQAEYVPFSFRLSNDEEERRPADILNRLIQVLDDSKGYKLTYMHQILWSLSTAESLYSAVDKDLRGETICIIFFIIATLE